MAQYYKESINRKMVSIFRIYITIYLETTENILFDSTFVNN
jgi:hypothetical protein